jgi:hypothetical protein
VRFEGGCHCGDLRVLLDTEVAPERTAVRLCQCGFCRRHGARAATDPAGHLTITIAAGARPSRYAFGLATAEFLVCARCGVFVAAVMSDGDRRFATLNLNALDRRAEFPAGAPVDYEGEDAAARVARRRERWTPATLREERASQ